MRKHKWTGWQIRVRPMLWSVSCEKHLTSLVWLLALMSRFTAAPQFKVQYSCAVMRYSWVTSAGLITHDEPWPVKTPLWSLLLYYWESVRATCCTEVSTVIMNTVSLCDSNYPSTCNLSLLPSLSLTHTSYESLRLMRMMSKGSGWKISRWRKCAACHVIRHNVLLKCSDCF